ncbi:MAG: SpoIID/LytB domain-containing protein [Myxococcota bacterium]
MRRARSHCWLMVCLALGLSVGRAEAALLEDLYSNRLLFDDQGHPLIPVRMMERQQRVELWSEQPLKVELIDENNSQMGGRRVVVQRLRGAPAPVVVHQVLETLEEDQRETRELTVDRWEKRGVPVRVVPVGGVYGVQGTVVDTRALLLVPRRALEPAVLERWEVRPLEHISLRGWPQLTVGVEVDGVASPALGTPDVPAVVRVRVEDGATLWVRDVEHNVGYANHGYADRELRGEVIVLPDRFGTLAVVNIVPEHVLVAGILPSEMFSTAPLEALKAQAVTARGELFAKIGRRHEGDPYVLCSEQHCQVYKGKTAETDRTNEAARATAGELAFDGERLVDSVYSACCGGHTEAAHFVWERREKRALIGRPDVVDADPSASPWRHPAASGSYFGRQLSHGAANSPTPSLGRVPLDLREEQAVRHFLTLPREATFCGRSSFNRRGDAYRWERRFTVEELDRLVADLPVGHVRGLRIDERGSGGRLLSRVIEGDAGTTRIHRALPVRKRFGNLRSGLFVIDEERNQRGELLAVTLRGAGYGHGAGMCQQGAIGMAEEGHDYRTILRHYFHGATVRRVF